MCGRCATPEIQELQVCVKESDTKKDRSHNRKARIICGVMTELAPVSQQLEVEVYNIKRVTSYQEVLPHTETWEAAMKVLSRMRFGKWRTFLWHTVWAVLFQICTRTFKKSYFVDRCQEVHC